MRRVAQTLPMTPARPNSTSASERCLATVQRVRNERRDVGEGSELADADAADHQESRSAPDADYRSHASRESDVPCIPAGTTRNPDDANDAKRRKGPKVCRQPRCAPSRDNGPPATDATDQPRNTAVIAAAWRSGRDHDAQRCRRPVA